MCGIAGELRFSSAPTSADWGRLSALMERRGPDDDGIWSGDEWCTLVFRRLAILDLSPAGHQPMTSEDGRHVLVFNGEVYNFPELRERLKRRGVKFRSRGDSEVVLYSLIEWGQQALERFNGMFALAFYDKCERRLLLARDHAGIKPLYYLSSPEGVAFASQQNQLLHHPWSRGLDVSKEALGLYLRLTYIPAPYAVLEGMHMLEPGTWLKVSPQGCRQGRFFEVPRYEPPSLTGSDAVEAVDAAVTQAVKRQLVSDVPVGAFLSGGIDSPLVVAKMAAVGNHGLRAFTVGTEDQETDESPDARIYARQLGVEHTVEQATPEQALSMLDSVIDACGEPFGDYSIFPTMMVSRLASRDFKVMLSGDGGDELLWGYAGRSAQLLGAAEAFRQPHSIRLVRRGIKKVFGVGNGHRATVTYASLGDWQRAKHQHLNEALLARVFPELPGWPEAYEAYRYTGWELDQTAQWLRWNEFVSFLPMVLLKVDRASMYHSLEVRVPLLDREVIAVAAQVDWQACLQIDDALGKLPLRQVLARHVQHQTKAKLGFEVPMGKWLCNSLRVVFEESLLNCHGILGLEIDRKALRGLFDQHVNGRRDLAKGLWPLLSLALWARHHYGS